MSDIKTVIDLIVRLMQTRITISPYSFTLMQLFIATCVISIIIWFIRELSK